VTVDCSHLLNRNENNKKGGDVQGIINIIQEYRRKEIVILDVACLVPDRFIYISVKYWSSVHRFHIIRTDGTAYQDDFA